MILPDHYFTPIDHDLLISYPIRSASHEFLVGYNQQNYFQFMLEDLLTELIGRDRLLEMLGFDL